MPLMHSMTASRKLTTLRLYNNRDGSALGIALDVNGEDFET